MIWLRRALCLPIVLISYAIVLFIRAAWGKELWWEEGVLFVRLHPDSWPSRTWFKRWGGSCFGHGIMLAAASEQIVIRHELQHTEQIESNTIAGLVAALALCWMWPYGLSLLLWPMMPVLCYLAGMLMAWARGSKRPYRDNFLERAAYDATDPRP